MNRNLLVWASSDLVSTREPTGYLSVVYVEYGVSELEKEIARYWRFSNHWPASHRPCVESLLKLLNICDSLGITSIGRTLEEKVLNRFEKHNLFACQVKRRTGSIWYPEDLQVL